MEYMSSGHGSYTSIHSYSECMSVPSKYFNVTECRWKASNLFSWCCWGICLCCSSSCSAEWLVWLARLFLPHFPGFLPNLQKFWLGKVKVKGNIEFLSHILGSLFWDLMVHCSSERTQAAVMPTAMHFKNRHFWQLRRLATLTWKKA